MTKINDLHRRWSKDADYKDAYDALGEEFDLARALIEARTAAGLSQAQLARRMKTSQSYIARIEGGKVRPSTDALERFAQATRTRLRIVFEPDAAIPGLQREQLVQIKRGEAAALDSAEVSAAAFDPEDLARGAVERVGQVKLGAGVAASEVGDAQVGTEQVGAVAEQVRAV